MLLKVKRVAVIGAGLSGLSVALALRNQVEELTLFDSQIESTLSSIDSASRSISLSYGSKQFFSSQHIWDELASYATPIQAIHISDKGHFGQTQIEAEAIGVPALGFSIAIQALHAVLLEKLKATSTIQWIRPAQITHIEPMAGRVEYTLEEKPSKLEFDLILLADGGHSGLAQNLGLSYHQKDYHQTAIVTNMTVSKPHGYTAYERFTASGPIALLPLQAQQMGLVWTVPSQEAEGLMQKTVEDFLASLQADFGWQVGKFEAMTPRQLYPLKAHYYQPPGLGRLILIGNAAHTVHPVAAQGFNLTLKDIETLAWDLKNYPQAEAISRYNLVREKVQKRVFQFTDGLIRLFSHNQFPVTPLRGWGLSALNHLPFLKHALAKRVMGYSFF